MSTATSPRALNRPATVTGAIWMLVLIVALAVPAVILAMDEFDAAFVTIAATLATLKLIGAAGLWRCRKWAMFVAFGATLLDALLGAGSIPESSGAGETTLVLLVVFASIVALVLLVLPGSRRAYV